MVTLANKPDEALLVLGDALLPWSAYGYGAPMRRVTGTVQVLTPASSVGTLAAGYRPQLHSSAHQQV